MIKYFNDKITNNSIVVITKDTNYTKYQLLTDENIIFHKISKNKLV